MSRKTVRPDRRKLVWSNSRNNWLSLEEQEELDQLEKIKQQLEFKKLEEDKSKLLKTDEDDPD